MAWTLQVTVNHQFKYTTNTGHSSSCHDCLWNFHIYSLFANFNIYIDVQHSGDFYQQNICHQKFNPQFFFCIFTHMVTSTTFMNKSSRNAGPSEANSKWYGPKYSGSQTPSSVRERVWCTQSDFWGLQDAVCHVTGKPSCRLHSSHASNTTTTPWYHKLQSTYPARCSCINLRATAACICWQPLPAYTWPIECMSRKHMTCSRCGR